MAESITNDAARRAGAVLRPGLGNALQAPSLSIRTLIAVSASSWRHCAAPQRGPSLELRAAATAWRSRIGCRRCESPSDAPV
jgi:hypothetical protein